MKKIELDNLVGIYVHIPFCAKKCNYCDFLSSSCDISIMQNYIDALLNEIRFYKNDKVIIKTIYIGGGTPSILDAQNIERILKEIKRNFYIDSDAEITIEVNPGTVNYDKLKAYYNMGINRISMGLQSANDEELKALGRIHTFETFKENYNNARKVGFNNINIDVMSAIPNQTLFSYKQTLNEVIKLKPEHISSYSLIIEEGTPFFEMQDELSLPNEDDERKMYYMTNRILNENGYIRYEISNYSKPNYESRHNSSYWTGVSYYGFGLGASSYMDGVRYNNEENLERYINILGNGLINKEIELNSSISLSAQHDKMKNEIMDKLQKNKEIITLEEQIKESIILGLRMTKGIDKSEFKNKFGMDIYDKYGDIINKYINLKFIQDENNRISLTETGIDISNIIMAEFI